MKTGVRDWLGRLALISISGALSLAFAEAAVRWLQPQPVEKITFGLYEADPPRRYRLTPHYEGVVSNGVEFTTRVTVNALGLRGPMPKSDDRPRLLVIGDSFTFGWGVEHDQAYVHLAAEELGFQGLNGGTPGFGLPDAADWLEAYGWSLDPDFVVLAVFVGNDLLDATEEHRSISVVGGLVSADRRPSALRRALDRAHVIRLVKQALPWSLQSRMRSFLRLPESWRVRYLREAVSSYALEPSELVLEGRDASEVAFREVARRCREKGVPLSVVLIPDALQLSDQRWLATLGSLGLNAADLDPEEPNRFFTEMALAEDIPILDLLPKFKAAGADGHYFTYDPHWTPAGHRLAADLLAHHVSTTLRSKQRDDPLRTPAATPPAP